MGFVIVPWKESWLHLFAEWRERLETFSQGLFLNIYHIGSTAVPGLVGKPLLDILGELKSWDDLGKIRSLLQELGFRETFAFNTMRWAAFCIEGAVEINLHIFCYGNPQIGRYLRFRDYLIDHPEARLAYAQIKNEIMQRGGIERRKYAYAKTPFIITIDRKALEEYGCHTPLQPILSATASSEQIIDAMTVNMAFQMAYYTRYVPVCSPIEERDLVGVAVEIPSHKFNYVLGARFTEENAAKRIEEIRQKFKEGPFCWWVGPLDTPDNLSEYLQKAGLQFDLSEEGMVCSLVGREFPASSLEIKRVIDREMFRVFDEVGGAVGGSQEAYAQIFSKIPIELYQGNAPVRCYLGFKEGRPVVTGIMVLYAGVAGFSCIITHPEYRHEDYAMSILQALLEEAKSLGYELAVLQANSDARSVHKKLGFKPLCRFFAYKKAVLKPRP